MVVVTAAAVIQVQKVTDLAGQKMEVRGERTTVRVPWQNNDFHVLFFTL